jgi:hypothetical protein
LYRIQEKGAKTFSQLAAEGKIPKVFNNEKIIAKKAEEEKCLLKIKQTLTGMQEIENLLILKLYI